MTEPVITRALSVRPPWWWFILHSKKPVENRDWPTTFRGRVLLHASKWYVHRDVIDDIWYVRRLFPGVVTPDAHPYEWLKTHGGCIVGSVEITDCVTKYDSEWFSGKYGFLLSNPVAFEKPVPFKGALGFFYVPPSITVEALRG